MKFRTFAIILAAAACLSAWASKPQHYPHIDATGAQVSPSNSKSGRIASRNFVSKDISPTAIGDTAADTFYTPLPNGRCRVADSRVINSPLPGGVSRQIDTEGVASYSSQGGSGSSAGDGSANCGIPEGVTALAVSVTVLSNGQEGFFKFYPDGVNYTEGNTVYYTSTVSAANDVVVRSCQSCAKEQSIYSSSSAHYVIDVVGYFMRPTATAMDCIETDPNAAGAKIMLAGNGGVGDAYTPACNNYINYTHTATNCKTDSSDAYLVWTTTNSVGNGICSAKNTGATTATLEATSTCCRIPGGWIPQAVFP